jgi:DNA modification methylase
MIEYELKDMNAWENVNADLIMTDPPFGIDFDGKEGNYNRNSSSVVGGYVEWDEEKYKDYIKDLLDTINQNLSENGQSLIFSGWNNSNIIHNLSVKSSLNLQGKLYWSYNFAPYCKKRPAHNVYEIFWLTQGEDWYYNNECSFEHCSVGEGNLSTLDINRDYHKDMPKYPTRLPEEIIQVLLEHYSEEEDLIFDPLAGSGMVGLVANKMNRDAVLGDLNENALEVHKEIKSRFYVSENENGVFDF